jgi:dipeptidase D
MASGHAAGQRRELRARAETNARTEDEEVKELAMTCPFQDLSPAGIWSHFAELVRIARPSKREQAAIEYLKQWAESRSFRHAADETGNLCVYVPATPGREDAPLVVLQGHVDIVASNAADRPADADAAQGKIPVLRVACADDGQWRADEAGDWIMAPHTTLGADNGIGVCSALAVAEDAEAEHGPLALLFTVDEEQGLTGANGLDPRLLDGAAFLVNLDNEDDDMFTVGCAGGRDVELSFEGPRMPPGGELACLSLGIGNLRGGHSGIDIHRGRANAIRLLAILLDKIRQLTEVRVDCVQGGDLRNAIPRSASARLLVPQRHVMRIEELVDSARSDFQEEFRGREDAIGVTVDSNSEDLPQDAFSVDASKALIDLLMTLPTGVAAMCADAPDLVETSDNLAIVTTSGAHVKIVCSCRSSSAAALREIGDRISSIARSAGAEAKDTNGYPGWQPDFSSNLLAVCKRTYEALFPDSELRIEAIHAGLECGALLAHCPGMEAISIGPTLRGIHAPGERVCISSVQKFYRLLLGTLKELSQPTVTA